MSNKDVKSINDEEKEDEFVKIIRKSSLKAVIDSPIKEKYNLNSNNSQRSRNNYQSIRYRRHNRMKTEKGKALNFLTVDESKINNPENNIKAKLVKFENNIENKIPKPENHRENKIPKPDNNMGILYKKQESQKETKFNQIENKNENKNNNKEVADSSEDLNFNIDEVTGSVNLGQGNSLNYFKQDNGKYRAVWVIEGKQYSKNFNTIKELKERMAKLANDLSLGQYGKINHKEVAQALRNMEAFKLIKANKYGGTLNSYVDNIIEDFLKNNNI